MSVILTSFENAGTYNGLKFSVARFQPKGAKYKTIECLVPVDKDGQAISMKGKTPDDYKNAVSNAYKSRWPQIADWLNSLKSGVDVILLCWCPYSKTSDEHVRQTGNFPCHTGLIGQMLQKHRPDIDVIMDEDREISLLQSFRPVRNDCLKCDLYEEQEVPCSWAKCCAGPYKFIDGAIRSVNPQYASEETNTIHGEKICVNVTKSSTTTTSQMNSQ